MLFGIVLFFLDEPVNDIGGGSGNTSPDAAGIGTDIAQLRAERSANGDGRVYHINFLASDGKNNGECEGQAIVSVPYTQAHKAWILDHYMIQQL
jgi:hypothetical protein